MAKSLNNGLKEQLNEENPQGNGRLNLEQLELPNMPKPEIRQTDVVTIKPVKWNGINTVVFETSSENAEVFSLTQKLWPILSKLRKLNVNVIIK